MVVSQNADMWRWCITSSLSSVALSALCLCLHLARALSLRRSLSVFSLGLGSQRFLRPGLEFPLQFPLLICLSSGSLGLAFPPHQVTTPHDLIMASPYQPFLTPGQQADAPKKPHLYIGNLSPRVTDYILTEIFAVAGTVVSAKIIQDRNFQHGGFNYGFVEYTDMRSAEQAMTTLNGRKIFDAEIRVNWAYQGQQNKEDTQHHYHVFVGDLSPEVNDDVLSKAFGAFGSMSEARVMWDMNSGKSRGYGFLSFRWVNIKG